jgi:thiol:disulfide interchange protein
MSPANNFVTQTKYVMQLAAKASFSNAVMHTKRHTRSMTATLQISALSDRLARRCVAVLSALASVFALSAAMAATPSAPPAPLSVDAAFPVVAAFESGKFVVKFDVLPGHYLYKDRFEVQANGQAIAKISLPAGKIKVDPNFGRVEVYEQPMSLSAATGLTDSTELTLVFQGCSAVAGVCYPPTKRTFTLASGARDVRAKELAAVSLRNQFKPLVSQ